MIPKDGGRVIGRTSVYKRPQYDILKMADLLLEHALLGGTPLTFPAWLIHQKGYKPRDVPHVETIRYWMKHHAEFRDLAQLAHDIAVGSEVFTLDAAKFGKIENYQFRPHQFKLMNMFGWKNKIEHGGELELTATRAGYLEQIARDPEAMALARQLAQKLAVNPQGADPAEEVKPVTIEHDQGGDADGENEQS